MKKRHNIQEIIIKSVTLTLTFLYLQGCSYQARRGDVNSTELVPDNQLLGFASQSVFQNPPIGVTVIPTAFAGGSKKAAKQILNSVLATFPKDFISGDVTHLHPKVFNGYYAFQVKAGTGVLLVIIDYARPRAAMRLLQP